MRSGLVGSRFSNLDFGNANGQNTKVSPMTSVIRAALPGNLIAQN